MVLLIDNYDSFTYNIYQYISYLNYEIIVKQHDEIDIPEIERIKPSHIIISPGPGGPESAGISNDVICHFKGQIPILGVCLGHQCIGHVFGGNITIAKEIYHGRMSSVYHDGRGVFRNLPNPFKAIRYHSLLIDREKIGDELDISAWTEEGSVMGIRHKSYSIEGVQFHPESYGSEFGYELLANFLENNREESFLQRGLKILHSGNSLNEVESERIMEELTRPDCSRELLSALLTALAMKGETVPEISGFAKVMRQKSRKIRKPKGVTVVDLCGTGGDGSSTFNISTAATFIASGAGVTVAKHGNRSVTSRCGSADLCEALGIQLNPGRERIEKSLEEAGIAFLFAPKLHPSLKHVGSIRKELGFRTLFNILGPLANPANADSQIIGVFRKDLVEKVANVLVHLNVKRAMVVHGADGLDEITLTGSTWVSEVQDGWIRSYRIDPEEFGLKCCKPEELKGGDLKKNADILLDILNGQPGAKRDIAVLNGAAAIYISGLAKTLKAAVTLAEQSIDSGAAKYKLSELIRISNQEISTGDSHDS